jgi:hypothetical protein
MAMTIAVAVVVPIATLLAGGLVMSWLSGRREHPGGEKPLMRRWGYSEFEAERYWRDLASRQELNAERWFLRIDLGFPLVYGAALLLGLHLVWEAAGRPFPWALLVAPCAVAMLADWTENVVQLRLLSSFPPAGGESLPAGAVKVASLATQVKLSAVLLSFGVIAVLSVCLAIR